MFLYLTGGYLLKRKNFVPIEKLIIESARDSIHGVNTLACVHNIWFLS
jgi:hypothetical protein